MSNQKSYRLYLQMNTQLQTLHKKRTANFREDETKLLIQLWGSPTIQNKLFLTHRKAPVMRILAANMQNRGFYRTPDEIKTRLRNLKCLYHRIKRRRASGTGIGIVDIDWPHFKAMDKILSKEYSRKSADVVIDDANESRDDTIQIKQEIDVDIDDNDSWTTNDSVTSEYEEPTPNSPEVIPTIQVKKTSTLMQSSTTPTPSQAKSPTRLSTFSIPTSKSTSQVNGGTSLSFPLLIALNNLQQQNGDKHLTYSSSTSTTSTTSIKPEDVSDISILLKELKVQKENVDIQKRKLEAENQRLVFDRFIQTQLITLIAMLEDVLQRLGYPSCQEVLNFKSERGNKRKRSDTDDVDNVRDSKILRNVFKESIQKYIIVDDKDKEKENDNNCEILHVEEDNLNSN